MSKYALLLLLFVQYVLPSWGSTRVTVEELSKLIASNKGKPDAKIAGRLITLELTERLNSESLNSIELALHGPESRRALVALADQAAILAPPPSEIPKLPPPSVEQQRELTAKAIEYIKDTLHRLPNLIAQRDTIRFEDTPAVISETGINSLSGRFIPAQPLHPVGRYTKTVSYRDGEEVDQAVAQQGHTSSEVTGLNSIGEFGPILTAVFADLPKGNLAWSRWENASGAAAAVFSFNVPRDASHYEVRYCCVNGSEFRQFAAYHGEITIAPDTGTILRIALVTDLRKSDPVKKATLVVEYGPVEVGKQTIYCPSKSISVIVAPAQVDSSSALPTRGTVPTTRGQVAIEVQSYGRDAPLQTMLNEVAFDQYHLFYSEARIVAANSPEAPQSATTPQAVSMSLPGATVDNSPKTEIAASGPLAAAAPAPVTPAPVTPAPDVPAPRVPAVPEIDVTPQKTPYIPDVPLDQARYSLRLNTRIVEVSVAVLDKKGHPVTDLTRDDFQIFDSSRKQTLRSFTRAGATEGATANAAPQSVATSTEFSNRSEAANKLTTSGTIVFFDATSLQFNDLVYAREQFLKLIATMPPSEPVGLYLRVGLGFHVLLEPTTDRTALTDSLNKWSPNATDLARAQEAEERNRQQFDTLRSPSAAISTYAMVDSNSGAGPMIGSDPRLFTLGEEPTRQALSVLVAVATHMGIMPGHKNLVWIASDNVLADWSETAAGDEGHMSPNAIGQYSARTQEALNNAHVSLYPFDASQLGTAATDASLENPGVDLEAAQKPKVGFRLPPGGRSQTQLRTQTRPVQIAMQQLAESTGGRAFGRSSNVLANLNSVIEDSDAVYLLSFAPDTQPDDKYHELKVTLPARNDVKLRYRSGYLYSKEPASLKERFAQILWQPFDASEIRIAAHRAHATGGAAIILRIDAHDVGLSESVDRHTGKLDVFLVKRDDTGARAMVKEQSLAFNLSADGYQRVMRDGIPFQQYIDQTQNGESVRMIVVDETSGRIGSITLPAEVDASHK